MLAKLNLAKFRPFRRPWVALRKAVQYLILFLFVALFVAARRVAWPASLVNLPMRLDPLSMFANMLASRSLLAGSALALLTVLFTIALGRAWCGWICPLGTTLDLFPLDKARQFLRGKTKGEKAEGAKPGSALKALDPSEKWRKVKYGLLIAILSAALFANLTLLFLDPLTIIMRALSTSIWPAMDQAITATEGLLYKIPIMQPVVEVADGFLRPRLFPPQPVFYRDAFLYAAVFFGVIGLNLFAPRFWCRYICPLGALLGLFSKAAVVRRQVSDDCQACQICTRACPIGTIDPQNNYASDPSECTMCLECLEDCPQQGIKFAPVVSPAQWHTYDPSRRQALYTLGAAAAGVALLRSEVFAKRDSPFLLRPPGGRDNALLEKCIRCGECVRACPTSAIQPALSEAGLEGLWTPVIVPRLGYCDYSCNACGQACPVQAIPPLSLDDKRQQIIGRAYIDQNRCIAWNDHTPCIVCEEMCPLPDKAVYLVDAEFKTRTGETVNIQLPIVDRTKCIGCGICENRCPVNGDAAIRIFVPNMV